MSRITREFYVCDYCKREYHTEAGAERCYLGHDIVFIGLERAEWRSLFRSIVEAGLQGVHFDDKVVRKLLKHKIGVSR